MIKELMLNLNTLDIFQRKKSDELFFKFTKMDNEAMISLLR